MTDKSHASVPVVHVLRGLTALIINLYHFLNYTDFRGALFHPESLIRTISFGGFDAVQVFFVISGFILPWSMYGNGYQLAHYRKYITKRILRIHPPYIVAVLLIVLLKWGFEIYNHLPLTFEPSRWIAHFFYTVPFCGFSWLNDIFWTLGIEMQYYLFIGLAFPLFRSPQIVLRFLPAIVLLGMNIVWPDARIFSTYAVPFCIGFLLFFYKTAFLSKTELLVGASALCFLNVILNNGNMWQTGFIVFAFLILFFEKPLHGSLAWLGECSYSLYLTHGLSGSMFLYFTHYHNQSTWFSSLIVLLALVLSLLTARVFWKIIEEPSRKWAACINWR